MKKVFLLACILTLVPFVTYAQVGDVDPNTSQCVELKNNLRLRDRDAQKNGEVSLLQDFLQEKGYLNGEPTGFFGQMTLKAVQSYQRAQGLNPTGFVGELTRGKIKSESGCNGTSTPQTFLPGCTSTQGFSSVNGNACDGATPPPQTYLPGCTSRQGFSSVNGNACDGSVPPSQTFLPGCTSTQGYSSVNGNACNGTIPPGYPAGCSSFQGYSSVTGNACNGSTPIVNPRQTIQVVSPNGGQTYINGGYGVPTNLSTVINIEYKSFGIVGQNLVAYLYHPVYGDVRSQPVIASNSATIQMDLAKGDTLVQPGEYKIILCAVNVTVPATGKPLCDSSDNFFKVVGETAEVPNLTIQNLEPVWYPYVNPTYDIKWSLSGDTSAYTHRYVQFVGNGTRYTMAKDFINENLASIMAPHGQVLDIEGRALPGEIEYSVIVCMYPINNPGKNICDTKGPMRISHKG